MSSFDGFVLLCICSKISTGGCFVECIPLLLCMHVMYIFWASVRCGLSASPTTLESCFKLSFSVLRPAGILDRLDHAHHLQAWTGPLSSSLTWSHFNSLPSISLPRLLFHLFVLAGECFCFLILLVMGQMQKSTFFQELANVHHNGHWMVACE
jgi:hypothetical protein